MALYGVGASSVPQAKMRHLRSTIATVLDPGAATGRNLAMAFESVGHCELDPLVHVWVERALSLRR
eukprot:14218746-Alexandrium_andersonii.AAC.1